MLLKILNPFSLLLSSSTYDAVPRLFLRSIPAHKKLTTVIAYHHIFQSHFDSSSCHFFNGIAAIAPVAVTVDDALDIAGLYQVGKRALFLLAQLL